MAIRIYRPYTAGTRNRSVSDFSEITSNKPEKTLLAKKISGGGRNNRGIIGESHVVVRAKVNEVFSAA